MRRDKYLHNEKKREHHFLRQISAQDLCHNANILKTSVRNLKVLRDHDSILINSSIQIAWRRQCFQAHINVPTKHKDHHADKINQQWTALPLSY